jgi:hypothetical protein
VLELLGTLTWRLPNWLDARMPHIDIEGSAARAANVADRSVPDDTADRDPTQAAAA